MQSSVKRHATAPADDSAPTDEVAVASFNVQAPDATNAADFRVGFAWDGAPVAGVRFVVTIAYDASCAAAAARIEDAAESGAQVRDLPEGTYYVCVDAIMTDGTRVPAQNNGRALLVDRTPPQIFAVTAPLGTIGEAQPTLVWSAAIGAERYTVTVAGDAGCATALQRHADLSVTSRRLDKALDDGAYHICVDAIDAAGNVRTETARFTVATRAPTVAFTSPSPGARLALAALSPLVAQGTCSESGRPVDLSGATQASVPCTAGSWTLSVDLAAAPQGNMTLTATQTNASGIVSAPAMRTFVVDSLAPTATLTDVPANPSAGAALNALVGGARVVEYRYALISGSAACADAVYSVWLPVAVRITDALAGSGTRRLCVLSRDVLGNEQTAAASYSWVRDFAPQIAVTQPADPDEMRAAGTTFTIVYEASDTDSTAAVTLFAKTGAATGCTDGNLTGWSEIAASLPEGTPGSYAYTPSTPGTYHICGRISDSVNAPVFALAPGSIHFNAAPTVSVTEPSGNDVIALNANFTVTFTASDTDDDAKISLYYKSSPGGACDTGQLFASDLSENTAGASGSYVWSTSGLAAGVYHVCARIDDDVNAPVDSWSPGGLRISAPPTISVTAPASNVIVPQVGSYAIAFTAADPDEAAQINLYYKSSTSGCADGTLTGWTQIVAGLVEGVATGHSWTTDAVPPGTYYVCARIDDSYNAPVTAISAATITVNAPPTLVFSSPSASDWHTPGTQIAVTWTATDPEDVATITLYRKISAFGSCIANEGTIISPTLYEGTDSSFDWSTTGLASNRYYLCARLNDNVNPVVDVNLAHPIHIYRTCMWTGATDTSWAEPGNWDACNNAAPHYDDVIIPAGPTRQPTVAAATAPLIRGFAAGAGGGTVTIGAGATLGLRGPGGNMRSSVAVQGASTGCSTCRMHSSGNLDVVDGARLTLRAGTTLQLEIYSYLRIGDGTSPGHLTTEGSATVLTERPRITASPYFYGIKVQGAPSDPSEVSIDGLVVEGSVYTSSIGGILHFVSDYELQKLDNAWLSFSYLNTLELTGHAPPMIALQSCTGATVVDNWNGIELASHMSYYGFVPSNVRVTGCSGIPTVTITGGGIGYGEAFEHDPDGVVAWTNGLGRTCTWTGANSTSWTDAGNWSGCGNGRGGYPDQLDWVVLTSPAPHQPTASGATVIQGIAAGGSGGTITVRANSMLSLMSASQTVMGNVRIQGETPTCSTCSVVANQFLVIGGGATLTLGSGVGVYTENGSIKVGAMISGTFNSGRFVTDPDGSADPATWPYLTAAIYYSYGVQVEGASAANRSAVRIDGLRVQSLTTVASAVGLRLVSNYRVEKLDRLQLDVKWGLNLGAGASYVKIDGCTGALYDDASWTDIEFLRPVTAGGYNVNITGCASLGLGALSITRRSGGSANAFGAAFANDPNGILTWN